MRNRKPTGANPIEELEWMTGRMVATIDAVRDGKIENKKEILDAFEEGFRQGRLLK